MVKMSHGPRSGSRRKLTKSAEERKKSVIGRFMQEFEPGDRVAIDIEPSVHSGMPYHRFQGYTGVVEGSQGDCYKVAVKVDSLTKYVIASPVHLKKIKG
ncbi:50S ribosomal protein L21e [Thermoplasma sp.]|uniref:50S ribosomal protein L21e n=1 Tax=Thermoplasma sp. TaxID=1973142 RepID=UPI001279DA8A|nr:50S ribosomal protein L21e [Thermoplasma sp.]KAA8922062.1 MAG: 50S ribosomal protein L21e [Thermoplasma sp.]